jgi:hypothetical protein
VSPSTFQVKVNTPFAWRRGLQLRALKRSTIVLPGNLVGENEAIGAIIQTSDDGAQVGFEEPTDSREVFGRIFLVLEQGMTLQLNRACEAIVLQEGETATFEVVP